MPPSHFLVSSDRVMQRLPNLLRAGDSLNVMLMDSNGDQPLKLRVSISHFTPIPHQCINTSQVLEMTKLLYIICRHFQIPVYYFNALFWKSIVICTRLWTSHFHFHYYQICCCCSCYLNSALSRYEYIKLPQFEAPASAVL